MHDVVSDRWVGSGRWRPRHLNTALDEHGRDGNGWLRCREIRGTSGSADAGHAEDQAEKDRGSGSKGSQAVTILDYLRRVFSP